MKLALLLTTGPDIGGQGVRLVQAFHRHGGDWEVRSMARQDQYMAYGADLPFRKQLAAEMYQQADVIHCRLRFDLYDQLAATYGPKPVILHQHGSLYRGNPNLFLRQARERNALVVVSTLDLWLLAPDESEWLPSPFDVDALREIRRAQRPEPQPRKRSGRHFVGDRPSVPSGA